MVFIWKIWKSHYQWFMQKRKIVLSILITILVFTLILNYTIDTEEMGQVESIISKCLFCNIANGRKPPVKLLYENEEYAILKDKYPASAHHYLAIPKQHYTSLKVLNKSHVGLVRRMHEGMVQFLLSKGVREEDAIIGYHIPPFISQKHLHLHGIYPKSEMSLSNRISFFMPSFWFKSSKDAIDSLTRSEL